MALLEAPGPVWLDDELKTTGDAPGAISAEVAVLMGTALGISPACHLRGDAMLGEHLDLLADAAATLGYHGVDAPALADALGDLAGGDSVIALVPGPAAHRAAPPGDDWSLVRWPAARGAAGPIDAAVSPTPRNHLSPATGVLLLDDTELSAGARAAQRAGRDGCVWVDLDGRLSCLDQGALVLRFDGRLVTPSAGCGAVRTAWRDALVRGGSLEEGELVLADLRRADSAACLQPWATVRPVARVGDLVFGDRGAAEELGALVDRMIEGRR